MDKLFQAAGPATENPRLPIVTVFVDGMRRSPAVADRRCERPSKDEIGTQRSRKYIGAVLWRHQACTPPSTAWTESSVEWKASGAAHASDSRHWPSLVAAAQGELLHGEWIGACWSESVVGQPAIRCNSRPDCEQVLWWASELSPWWDSGARHVADEGDKSTCGRVERCEPPATDHRRRTPRGLEHSWKAWSKHWRYSEHPLGSASAVVMNPAILPQFLMDWVLDGCWPSMCWFLRCKQTSLAPNLSRLSAKNDHKSEDRRRKNEQKSRVWWLYRWHLQSTE